MLMRFISLLCVAQYFHRESRRKNEFDADSMSSSMISSLPKDLVVRIIHAGRFVELYQGAIPASYVLEKYPKMCIARPEVFKWPHESIIGPNEDLMPGQKFYLIPQSTVNKLKRKHRQKKMQGSEDKTAVDGAAEESDCESVCSAKNFYVCRETWSTCWMKRLGGCEEEKKPFVPPIKEPRLRPGFGWQPSLSSIEEVSP